MRSLWHESERKVLVLFPGEIGKVDEFSFIATL